MATEGEGNKEGLVPVIFQRVCIWKDKYPECVGIIEESTVYRTPEQAAKIKGGILKSHTVCDPCIKAGRTLFQE